MEKDINETLLLNGVRKANGTVRDTATEVLKGRRDTCDRARRMMAELNRRGKCNSITVKRLMDALYGKEEREEYVGVKIFCFTKKYKSFVKRGLTIWWHTNLQPYFSNQGISMREKRTFYEKIKVLQSDEVWEMETD